MSDPCSIVALTFYFGGMMSPLLTADVGMDTTDPAPPSVEEIHAFTERLAAIRDYDTASADIEVITALERLHAVGAAGQASVTAHARSEIRRDRRERGRAQTQWDKGIALQIGLARMESHHRGGTYLGMATALTEEMPHTLAAMRAGRLNEFRAIRLVRETACLTADDRREVDRRMCADPATLDGIGTTTLTAMAAAHAAELDSAAVVRRKAKAVAGRRVTTKPAPDYMAYLTATMPMDQAVCAWATLRRDAMTLVGTGAGGRTQDQVMTDLLFQRITGTATATGAPVAVQLVISDETLLGGGDEPAFVPGYGPVPASAARAWIAEAVARGESPDEAATVTLRRLYANPSTGELTGLESRARAFPGGLARFIDLRDRTCRTPWCDAPIRHQDHVRRHADGGETSAENGQGLCTACNLAKEADDWSADTAPDPQGVHTVTTQTPTGHRYTSRSTPQPAPRGLRDTDHT